MSGTGSALVLVLVLVLVLGVPALRELFHFSGEMPLILATGLLSAAVVALLSTIIRRGI